MQWHGVTVFGVVCNGKNGERELGNERERERDGR
jgi:hypothetical protein